MADWVTISSLATAGGTLVLAVATFSSVRSANRSARVAERSLLAGLRPVLIPSREDDPDRARALRRRSGAQRAGPRRRRAAVATRASTWRSRCATAARGWRSSMAGTRRPRGSRPELSCDEPPDIDEFRRQQLDLYIPAGDTGYWQGAIARSATPDFARVRDAAERRRSAPDRPALRRPRGRTAHDRALSPGGLADEEADRVDVSQAEGRRASVLRYGSGREDPR